MTPLPRAASAVLVPLLVVLTGVVGCSRASSPPLRPPIQPPSGSVADQLRTALVTLDDLPSGYTLWEPRFVDEPPPQSDRPDCVRMLDSLEVDEADGPGVVEVRASYAIGEEDSRVQHILRRLPGTGAADWFDRARHLLGGCGQFQIQYPDGWTVQETVTPDYLSVNAPASVAVWSARIDLEWTGDRGHGATVLMRSGELLGVLSITDAELVDPLWVSDLAGRLAGRIAGQGGAGG